MFKSKFFNWLGTFAIVAFLIMVVNVSEVNATEVVDGIDDQIVVNEQQETDATEVEEEPEVGGTPLEDDELLGDDAEDTPVYEGWIQLEGEWYYYGKDGAEYTGWLKSGKDWYYIYESHMVYDTEWYEIDGKLYAFDKNGVMRTGWDLDEGEGYYENGYKDEETGNWVGTDWVDDPWSEWYYYGSDGAMVTGWQKIGKDWYYFGEYGTMYADGIHHIGGVWNEETEEYDGGAEYAFKASGAMITGWYEEKHEGYYENGYEDEETGNWVGTDWVDDPWSIWYYFKSNGMHRGWLQLGKTWYYFDEDGWMLNDCIQNIGGVWNEETEEYEGGAEYAFKASGAMVTGWYEDKWYDEEYDEYWSDWYYFKSSGEMHYGWLQIGKTWYFLDYEYGYMYADTVTQIAEGWIDGIGEVGGEWFYGFKANGAMVTGWYENKWYDEDEEEWYSDWYYFKSSGKAYNGWLKSGGKWYYLEDGYMYSEGVWEVDGVLYGFNPNGTLASGWVYDTCYEEWYYANKDGVVNKTGWIKDGSTWYYVEDGWMYYGDIYTIDGIDHEFDINGKWLGEVA